VQILATFNESTGPEILLESQFRPPRGKSIIQFPAGFVEDAETPEQSAARELKEETGYTGDVVPDEVISPTLYPCKY